jgi:hypothetical protein
MIGSNPAYIFLASLNLQTPRLLDLMSKTYTYNLIDKVAFNLLKDNMVSASILLYPD